MTSNLAPIRSFVEPTGPTSPPPVPPVVIVGPVQPGQPQYVSNPHLFNAVASALTCAFAAGSTVWAVAHDNPYVTWLFAATLLFVAVTVGFTRALNSWDQT